MSLLLIMSKRKFTSMKISPSVEQDFCMTAELPRNTNTSLIVGHLMGILLSRQKLVKWLQSNQNVTLILTVNESEYNNYAHSICGMSYPIQNHLHQTINHMLYLYICFLFALFSFVCLIYNFPLLTVSFRFAQNIIGTNFYICGAFILCCKWCQ